MSQRGKGRQSSQLDEEDIPPTIAPTLLYTLHDGAGEADQDAKIIGAPASHASDLEPRSVNASGTPALRRHATAQTPFHEPHLNFTPSQNTLATLTLGHAPLLAPLNTLPLDSSLLLSPILNQNERLLDEDDPDTNATQPLTPKPPPLRTELLSPLDNISSPEEEEPERGNRSKGRGNGKRCVIDDMSEEENVSSPEEAPKKTKRKGALEKARRDNANEAEAAEAESEGEKVRLVPLSDENWRDRLASDPSDDITSPTVSKMPMIKKNGNAMDATGETQEIESPRDEKSPWKEREEESEDVVSPKPRDPPPLKEDSLGFNLAIPSPLPRPTSPKPKESPKTPLRTLKVVEVRKGDSPNSRKESPYKSPPSTMRKVLTKRKRDDDSEDKGKGKGRGASEPEILSISSMEHDGAQAKRKREISDYLDPKAKLTFDSDQTVSRRKQIITKNRAKDSDDDEEIDDFDIYNEPIHLRRGNSRSRSGHRSSNGHLNQVNQKEGQRRKGSRKSDSVGHRSRKRKYEESSYSSDSNERSESETRPNKRRRVIRLHDSSSETPSSESSYPSSISSSVSLKRKTASLFEEKAPQKRRPKEIDAINSEYLLEVDYPLYIQEEDLWFLYEPPAFAAVSNQLPRSRIFQGCTFILTGFSLRPDTPSHVPSLVDSVSKIAKSFGAKIAETPPPKLFLEEVILETDTDGDEEVFSRPNCFLLAPSHLRTAKYLQALGLGIPCVHYSWLIYCYHFNRFLDPVNFFLKAGMSSTGKIISQPRTLIENFPRNDVSFLFYNEEKGDAYRVEVVGDADFRKSVELIARSAGAKIVSRLLGPYQKESRLDFLISDPTPSHLVRSMATKKGLPLLTREWLIQCLVRNELISETEDGSFSIPNPVVKGKR